MSRQEIGNLQPNGESEALHSNPYLTLSHMETSSQQESTLSLFHCHTHIKHRSVSKEHESCLKVSSPNNISTNHINSA